MKYTDETTETELNTAVRSVGRGYHARAPPSHMSREEAWRIVGGLSKTEKMPCYSWGVSIEQCRRGAVLAKKPGTVCSLCYARKGSYEKDHVQRALHRRRKRLKDPRWVDAMTSLLKDERYFRWFDSGDLLGLWHLCIIVDVCRRTSHCRHWLATREYEIVKQFVQQHEIPESLNIRLSADFIDQELHYTPIEGCTVSTVSTVPRKDTHNCPASFGPFSKRSCALASCTACWDRSVPKVNYRLH